MRGRAVKALANIVPEPRRRRRLKVSAGHGIAAARMAK